ncbi:hypothetical protein Tco_1250645 [Tanacetum coccineum]
MIVRAETVKDHQDCEGECWAILMGHRSSSTGIVVVHKKELNAFYVLRQRKTKASSKSFLSQQVTTRTQQQGMFESGKLARRRVKERSKIARESNKKDSKRMQQER